MPENTQQTEPMPQVQPVQPAPQKSKKTLWWILGGCGCLTLLCAGIFAAIFGLGYFSIKDSQKPADEFFQMVKNGKVDEAYNATSAEFQKQTTKSQWSDFVKLYELEKNEGVSWSKTEKDNDRTKLQGKLKLPSGDKDLRLDLVKENDVWKVYGLRLE